VSWPRPEAAKPARSHPEPVDAAFRQSARVALDAYCAYYRQGVRQFSRAETLPARMAARVIEEARAVVLATGGDAEDWRPVCAAARALMEARLR